MFATFAPVISGLLLGRHATHATPPRSRAHPRMGKPTSGSSGPAHPDHGLSDHLATSRAHLEALAASPWREEARSEEHVREMDAAEALWYRLNEAHRRLQHEGQWLASKVMPDSEL